MNLRFGIALSGQNPTDYVSKAMRAEKLGFDSIVLGDHLVYPPSSANRYDSMVLLTMIALNTQRVTFSLMVADPFKRHPVFLAQSLCTLDQISGGRVFLTIGAGEPMHLVPIGIPYEKPVSRLDEAVRVIKLALGSSPASPVSFDGKFFKLKGAFLQVAPIQRPRPPIYVAGVGEKTKALAASQGDGYFNQCDTSEGYAKSVAGVSSQLKSLGRKPESYTFGLFQRLALAGTLEDAVTMLNSRRSDLAWFPRKIAELGYEVEDRRDLDLVHFTMDKEAERARMLERLPLEALKEFACCGTVDDGISQLELYVKAGARFIVLANFDSDFERGLGLSKRLMDYLRETYGE